MCVARYGLIAFYIQSLSNEDQQSVKEEKSETFFRFGSGKVFKSIKYFTIPRFISNKNTKNYIPLLLTKNEIMKTKHILIFLKIKS